MFMVCVAWHLLQCVAIGDGHANHAIRWQLECASVDVATFGATFKVAMANESAKYLRVLHSLPAVLVTARLTLHHAPIVSCLCRAAASHALSHRPDALACRSVQRRPNRAVLSATSAAMRRSLDHKCAAQVAYGCVRSVIYVAVGAQAYSAKHPRLVDPEFLRKLLSAFTTEVRR